MPRPSPSPPIGPQEALIYTMVLMAASDGRMPDSELRRIGDVIRELPAFRSFPHQNFTGVVERCTALIGDDDGLDRVLDMVGTAVTGRLRETAYALACEIALADAEVGVEEMRLLDLLREEFDMSKLVASAIERGIAARFRTE